MTKSKSHRTQILHITYPTGVKEITQDLPKDELVRRMKMLARSFQDMEQEEDNSQYEPLAIHITENYFLKHSSKDVRLLVACCVADVFRIFAPEAPYRTAAQLKTIFKFFCEQLWDLETTTSPLWKRYFYLLENLAMVKSFNICMELEDSNEIFVQLFTIFFSIVNKNHPPKVKGFMLDVMCPLISENDSVSPDLLEVILKYLIESKGAENPHANQLAKELIKRTATSIEPAMQTYFNNALVLGKSSDSELSSHTYELIYQLNLISNNLLLAVLPQLEFKLKTSEEKERLAVTKLLGRMFSDRDSDLAAINKPLWNCFLGRFSDISCAIRIQCVNFFPELVGNHPYLVEDLADRLRERVHDVEDDVRIASVQALVSAAKNDITVISAEMLELVKERTLDKKWRIRKESILGLAHIYKKWCHSDEAAEKDKDRLLWIKDKILHSYYLPELDDKLLVERIFTMNLVPYTLAVPERMQRFLELFVTVDEHSVKAIIELAKCQHIVRTHLRDLLEALQKQKDGDQSKVVFTKVIAIAKCLPDSNKTQEHLKKMVKTIREDARLLTYMKLVVSPDVTSKKAAHAVGEVMKKFSSSKSGASPVYNTVKTLMERVAPLIQDTEATKEFLKIVSGYIAGTGAEIKGVTNKEVIQKALRLIQMLAHVYPYTFKSEESLNCLTVMIQNEEVAGLSDTALQTLTQVGDSFEDHFPEPVKALQKVLTDFATTGSRHQAKHSIRCMNCIYTTSKKEILEAVFKTSQKSLSLDHEHYFTALTTVAHLAHLAPEQFLVPMKTVIAGTIVKGILMQDRKEGSKAKGIWCLDEQLCEETQGKLLAIKVLVHWLLGLGKNISGSVISTIRLLTTMLKNEGDLMERKKIGRADMSRLRLAAGCALLKLAQEPNFTEFISLEQFQLIALLINDECFQVREKFADKLSQGLISLRLPLSYMSILCLSAKDPVKENQKKALGYVKQCIIVRRQYLKQHNLTGLSMLAILPEYVVPHTIHLLSHDPDFVTPKDLEALNDIKECLWFILEPLVSKPESASFVRKMLQTIKQMKDAQAVEDKQTANKKLYAVCEVGLGLITTKLPGMAIKDHPGDIVLPGRLFLKPKKPFNPRDSYLPKKLQQEFSQVAEAKEGEGNEEKGEEKKKQAKGAAGKKKSGDENKSPLGKKEDKDDKTEDKKTAKSRKVLTQKEENDLNRSKRSLRGKGGSTPKKNSSPSKKSLSSSPEVQSPKLKTKQTKLDKFVTSKKRSSSSSPASQVSPTKSQSDASSSAPSPAKRRREAVPSKSSKDEAKNEVKDAKKPKGIKALLQVKDKGDKKMVKTNKVATIKRQVTSVSRTDGGAKAQKRRASSPQKASPKKRTRGTSETPQQEKSAKIAKSPTKKSSPVKSTGKNKTPVSVRRNQQNKKADSGKKKTPTPSPKKSAKTKTTPPATATRRSRKQSPSPSPVKRRAGREKQSKPSLVVKTPTSSPARKSGSSISKTPLAAKKPASPAAKKGPATNKARRWSSRSASPAKQSPVRTRGRPSGARTAKKLQDKAPTSPSKSPKSVTKTSQRGRRATPGRLSVGLKAKVSPGRTPQSTVKSTKTPPASPAKSTESPRKSSETTNSSKKVSESPAKNVRRGRPKASTKASNSNKSSKKSSPTKSPPPSPQKSASSSTSKSPKSPPKVRRVRQTLTASPKPSPVKQLAPQKDKAKLPAAKSGKVKTNRSSGRTPSRDAVKRKLLDSERQSSSSPAGSSRSANSSAKSTPRKSPGRSRSLSSPQKSPKKEASSPKKNVRQASKLTSKGKVSRSLAKKTTSPAKKTTSPTKKTTSPTKKTTSPARKTTSLTRSKSGKDLASKRKASSRSPSVSPKKRKIAKSPKKPSSPAKSALNISRKSHWRKKR